MNIEVESDKVGRKFNLLSSGMLAHSVLFLKNGSLLLNFACTLHQFSAVVKVSFCELSYYLSPQKAFRGGKKTSTTFSY